MGDNIKRAEPIVIRAKTFMRKEDFDKWAEDIKKQNKSIVCIPCDAEVVPADAVSRYAEWLEDIIVKAETLEWLCEETPCKEWCDENCHYSSIQVECLRHLYEVRIGGDDE